MPIPTSPYFDDFDPAENYLQLLFHPSRPVQARELTTMQSILSNQIGVHAKHIFKEGTQVIGGQLTIKRIMYVVVEDTYSGFPVVIEEFDGKEVEERTTLDAPTNYIGTTVLTKNSAGDKIIFVDAKNLFEVGNRIKVKDEAIYATVKSRGFCFYLGINEGVFFIDNKFVNVEKQSIILEDFNSTPTGRAGLTWSTGIVTANEDINLLDPARGTDNYGAAGADRLKYNCTLVYVAEGETPPDNFASLYEIRDGDTKSITNTTVYSDLAKELARRTYDESGNYTVNPFALSLGDGIKNKVSAVLTSGVVRTTLPHNVTVGSVVVIGGAPNNNGKLTVSEVIDENQFRVNTTFSEASTDPGITYIKEADFSVDLGKGKAYVRGYEIEKISSSEIAIPRAREKQRVDNYNIVPALGNYIIVTNLTGAINVADVISLPVYDATNGTGTAIGTVRVSYIRYHSGAKGATDARYRLYIISSTFNSGKSIENARSFKSGSFVCNVASEAIVSSKAQLVSAASSTYIYEIPQPGVATLQPSGTPSTSFSTHQQFTGGATGQNITFSLGSGTNTTFYGPNGSNFAGSDIELNSYHFVNTSSGAVLNVTSIIISNGGKQIDVTFSSAGGNVSALIPVQTTNAIPRTKTRAQSSVTITAGAVNPNSRFYTLSHVDIIEIVSATVNGVDYKDRFKLDSGQRDTTYEFGSIELRVGNTIPNDAPLIVTYNRYAHSGTGYFSVDSYPDAYEDIPTFTSPATGKVYQLTDSLDFRPSPQNAQLPLPNIPVSADYEFYLPRKDAIVIYWNGVFDVVTGRSNINPAYPKIPEDAMVLYYLDVPPYTKFGDDVQTRYVDNKRYTMRDIGRLEKRIDRLEYYTQLSFLEFDTNNTPIYDENGLERFKNGFLVDSFTGHGVGNVDSGDYLCAVDPENNELRPSYNFANVQMYLAGKSDVWTNDNTKEDTGEIITLPWDEETLVWNNIASRVESVTPFLITDVIGNITCNPPSDDWVDTTKSPALMVNLDGDGDAWRSVFKTLKDSAPGFGTQWNAWETTWSGSKTKNTPDGGTKTTDKERQKRKGTKTKLSTEKIENSLGEYVTDVNLAYYMRQKNIKVKCTGMRPDRDYHVFFDDENVNSIVTPVSGYEAVSAGVVRSDAEGDIKLVLHIPDGVYRTGERMITVTDDSQNINDNATSYATYVFVSSGLQQTVQETVVSTRIPKIDTKKITQTRTVKNVTVTDPPAPLITERHDTGPPDPLAQTFFVSSQAYPNGVFVTSAVVYIRSKPTTSTVPLRVQLRNVTNGYPDSAYILPFSDVLVKPSQILVPTQTENMENILAHGTRVEFEAPVYLEPGKEYALVLMSASIEYETYLSVMGQNILGTQVKIMSQVDLGSLFKSQNASTWTAFQNEDLMFKLNKAVFPMNTPGVVTFNADREALDKDVYINEFTHNFEPVTFSNVTKIEAEYQDKDASSLVLSTWAPYDLKFKVKTSAEKVILTDSDFRSRLTLTTTNKDVSPFLDLSRNSVITIHNQVNNLGLIDDGLIISSNGSGFTGVPDINVTGGGGSNAVLTPVINGGIMTDVIITNPGYGFTSSPTITVTGGGGSGASIIYRGFETDPSGGNAKARYITRNIALEEGFETDYVTVTLDINKQFGTDIQVYYKALAPDDSETLELKNWVKMKQKSDKQIISGDEETFTEVVYIPTTDTIQYTINGNTYTRANVVAVKVLLLSDNTSVVPKVKNLRAVTTAL